jgi:hypothetical protein
MTRPTPADVRIEALTAERDRLREVLQKIADWPEYRLPSPQSIALAAINTGKDRE